MYGFESQIAANRAKTFFLAFGFIAVLAGLGWFVPIVLDASTDIRIDSGLSYVLMAGCLIFAVFSTGISYWYSDKIICNMVHARPANPMVYIEKYFIDTVEGLVLACGLPAVPRAYVIESDALNAFATGRDPQHSIVCVTTGLLAALDRQELEGVLGHEMSHIYNRDILLMGMATVLVGGIAMFSNMVVRIMYYGGGSSGRRRSSSSDSSSSSGGGILLLIGLIFVILAPIFANLLNLMLSRKREFLADATGVKLTRNPEGLISALKKISDSPETMPGVSNELAAMFIEHPQHGDRAEGGMAGLFATHPPVAARIRALEKM